jgi:phosphate transport system substrate-binding protein
MSKWAAEYEKAKGVRVNYQSVGSGGGIQQMTSKIFDFGCTDAPLNEEQLAKARQTGGDVIYVPLVMGAAVPAYNLPEAGEKPLRFTGEVLADIYLGKVKKWNDKALEELNPGANLPSEDIVVVHRSEGSGTTFMWVQYLAALSPEWKEKVGVGLSVNWPVGVGQKGTEGVAGQVKRTAGSIGYIELIYALQNKIPYGLVKNREGEFIKASPESVTAAAASVKEIPDDLCVSLTNAPGKDSYPLGGITWAVIYQNQPPEQGKLSRDFLRWIIHEGQEFTKDLDYARIPKAFVERAEKKLEQAN